MRTTTLALFLAIATWPCAAFAQSGGASPNKVQEREIFDQTTQTFAHRSAEAGSAFANQCTSVLGLGEYCACLGKDMPTGVGFDNFVVVLTRTKEENGYAKLDATSRRAYDAVPALRDKCAAMMVER